MNLALWILFGALVGWIASLLSDGLSARQAEMMTLLGVFAGILGGWIMNVICSSSLNELNIYSVITAVLVAGTVIWYYGNHLYTKK